MPSLPTMYYQVLFTLNNVGLPSLSVTADVYDMTGTKILSDAPVTAIGGGVYAWQTTSPNVVAVVFKTTISGNPIQTLGLPVKEWSELTAAEVWTHPHRTLIQPGISLETPVSGNTITLYKDATNVLDFSELGNLGARAQIWFTVKANLDLPDDEAILQVTETGHLIVINHINAADLGPEVPEVDLIATDDGNVTIDISAEASQALPVMEVTPVEWDLKIAFIDGRVLPLRTGTAYIKQTATKSIA